MESKSVDFIVGDLKNTDSYKRELINFNPDKIIHLAWEGLPNYSEENCIRNYESTMKFFQTTLDTDCKEIVCTGTCWEYAENQGMIDEGGTLDTSNAFKFYKNQTRIEGRKLLKGGAKLTWVRPFFIYGRGQRADSLIPLCIRSLMKNSVPDIKNPDAINDFIHVSDAANGISVITNNQQNSEIYNLGSGSGTAVWEVVNMIATKLGKKPSYTKREKSNSGNIANINSLRSKGWKIRYDMNKGIEEVISQLIEEEE